MRKFGWNKQVARQDNLSFVCINTLSRNILGHLSVAHFYRQSMEIIAGFNLRPIQPQDNPSIAEVIRQVSAEHGLTEDKGYGVADPTLDDMYSVYSQDNAMYWVIEYQGKVVGGGGFAPLAGKPEVCELQKMYFLEQTRGHGLAKRIVALSLKLAKQQGYKQMYLETTECLDAAIKLYESLGFEHLDRAWGETGHDACEVVMAKAL